MQNVWVLKSRLSKMVMCLRFGGKHFGSGDKCDIRVVALVPLLRSIPFHVCDVVTWTHAVRKIRMM
eukprot:COSAG02_NODE_207_length_29119_cov_41.071365_12_plen_66_part_00